MDQLRSAMSDFIKIEYSMECFVSLLEDIEELYKTRDDEEHTKTFTTFKVLARNILVDLSSKISEIDSYILNNKE